MSGEGEGGGKLPSVDHGRRTDKGRDKKDVDPVARMESFRALKLSRLESFRVLKS